jgi:hypothetical protein
MAPIRVFVLLSACTIAGCGRAEPTQPFAAAPTMPGEPAEPARVCIDPNAPLVPVESFARITGNETLGELVRLLGPAHADLGSGLYVLVWRGVDGRVYRASVASLTASARPSAGFVTR